MSRINDVVVKIGTVNGTGSASANGLLMKAIFRMGVPVVGKNYFPSNIQGLPTWYEVRVTGDGYQARADRVDIMVAMNAQTYQRDMAEVASGGWLIYDSTWPRSRLLDREDINVVGVPLSRMCNETFDGARAFIPWLIAFRVVSLPATTSSTKNEASSASVSTSSSSVAWISAVVMSSVGFLRRSAAISPIR